MRILRRCLVLLLCVATVYAVYRFASVNSTKVDVDLLVALVEGTSLWIVVLVSALAGAAIALLFILFELIKKSLLAHKLRKKIGTLEEEVHGLRALPLSGIERATDSQEWSAKEHEESVAEQPPREV